jgi:AcrR family transcriptional regulator
MPTADGSTRDQILDAAEALFARQGFAATTIKEIGTAAGVNSALLYYYFADKATLYEAVLRRVITLMATTAGERLGASPSPEAGVRAFLAAQVEVMAGNPSIPKLLMREMLDHDAEHAQRFIVDTIAVVFRRLCDVIREGQRVRLFRRDVRPEFAAISIISQVVYLFVAKPAAALLLGHGDRTLPAHTVREFADHAATFALAALAAPTPARARARRSPVSGDRT